MASRSVCRPASGYDGLGLRAPAPFHRAFPLAVRIVPTGGPPWHQRSPGPSPDVGASDRLNPFAAKGPIEFFKQLARGDRPFRSAQRARCAAASWIDAGATSTIRHSVLRIDVPISVLLSRRPADAKTVHRRIHGLFVQEGAGFFAGLGPVMDGEAGAFAH